MSQKTHSQDSASDPRNEDDYDTWEYGTEPIPHDKTWDEKSRIESKKNDDYIFEEYEE